jgi:hypothetical protein
MSKHTPEPWKAIKLSDGNYEIVAGEDDSPLALAYGDDTEPLCWPVGANARLMAAAPALLSALKSALGAMNYMGDQLNAIDLVEPEDEEVVTPAFDAVRAALAKVGEEGDGES